MDGFNGLSFGIVLLIDVFSYLTVFFIQFEFSHYRRYPRITFNSIALLIKLEKNKNDSIASLLILWECGRVKSKGNSS